ncbi:MAG: N-acetylmuramoyl-L-alanine amidase-like domain-containing protein [Saprospiraceae bacterium]
MIRAALTILPLAILLLSASRPATGVRARGAAGSERAFPLAARFLFDPADRQILAEKIACCNPAQPLPARVLAVAQSFLGAPYAQGLLDQSAEEQLSLNLRGLDCWTFVEYSLAIALAADAESPAEAFPQRVQQLRYRGGKINGYGSRLHYFSSWLAQAQALGYLTDITGELPGAAVFRKPVNYMTTHPNAYPALKNPETRQQIDSAERRLSLQARYFIPQQRVKEMENAIQDGDLIAITSGKPGLDIAHEGFAVRVNGRVHLLHASSLAKRVVISVQPLAEYLIAQRGQTGIWVARLGAKAAPTPSSEAPSR